MSERGRLTRTVETIEAMKTRMEVENFILGELSLVV